jgi:hypothetical protein
VLAASGTVKDNLLIFGEGRKLGLELGKGNGPLQLKVSEPLFTVIGTDEQGLSRPQLLKGFLGSSSYCFGHGLLLINLRYSLPEESGPSCTLSGPNQRENLVHLEENQEAGAGLFLAGRIDPPAQGAQEFGILLFSDFSQVKPLALIARAVFHEQIGGVRFGLQVAMG